MDLLVRNAVVGVLTLGDPLYLSSEAILGCFVVVTVRTRTGHPDPTSSWPQLVAGPLVVLVPPKSSISPPKR